MNFIKHEGRKHYEILCKIKEGFKENEFPRYGFITLKKEI